MKYTKINQKRRVFGENIPNAENRGNTDKTLNLQDKVCFYGRKWRDDTIHKIRIRCYIFLKT